MRNEFYDLADYAKTTLKGGEVYTAVLAGETSDFTRFNHAKVRQAGTVSQSYLHFRLIDGGRNAEGTVALSGSKADDRSRVADLVKTLREQLAVLPEDPYLLYATEVRSSEKLTPSLLPDGAAAVEQVAQACRDADMVGIYAAGAIYRGFANSLGQRNWFETHSFNLDWSFYARADKAVKTNYAGFVWDEAALHRKIESAREQLAVLERPAHTVKPGRYRAYLAPSALHEVTDMLSWGGFGLKAHRTKQTPLIRMVEAGAKLSPLVTLRENTEGGIAPDFSGGGYVKPAAVTLVEHGAYKDTLISPRSAREYSVVTNGADGHEAPVSLEMAHGDIPMAEAAARLGEGVYINNLWYLNYSDRPACRLTGMTRFASFWVEKGRITAPLNVMRFDETVYRLLGADLVGLTREREMMLSASTYGQRSTGSAHLPGALVEGFTFTL